MVREIAAAQHGVLARRQALAAGFPDGAIRTALRRGRWTRLHAGVYRVTLIPARREVEMAAVLACPAGAVISHHTAASLWDILPLPRSDRGRARRVRDGGVAPSVHLTVSRGRPRSRPQLRIHRSPGLTDAETTTLQSVPITTPARTLLDLAADLDPLRLEQAVARAQRAGLCDLARLQDTMDVNPRRAGTAALRAILGQSGGPALTRSEAEARFLALLRTAELEPPRANRRVEGYEVDFLWPAARLVVEIDGRAFHSSPDMFERDRGRDAALTGAGYRVQRFTWLQITRKPQVVLVRVAQALAWKR